ncbi:MAG: hypothetical protein DRJ52_07930, partial [Thermoprotei archaeon]
VKLYTEAKLGDADFNSYARAYTKAKVTLEVEYPDVVVLEVEGSGSTSPAPGTYEVWESSFSASASPAAGWVFKYWLLDGSVYSTNPSINPDITKDTVLTAVFEEQQPQKFRLTISVQGQGSTSPPPGTYSYVEGSEVTVSASPAEGWKFSYWLLDGVKKTGNPITVTMNKDHTLVAVFEESGGGESPPPNPPPPPPQPKKYKLSIRVQGQGSTSPSPGTHYYDAGTVVSVKAYPSKGWRFKYWLLDGSVKLSNPIEVTMNKDHVLTAVFEKIPQTKTTYIKVDKISVEVYGCWWSNSSVYTDTPNLLVVQEHFVAKVTVEASEYTITGGPGGIKAAQLTLTVLDKNWFMYSHWNGTLPEFSNKTYTVKLTINKKGKYEYWLPLPDKDTFKSVLVGVYKFDVNYQWTNTRDTGSGTTSCTVKVLGDSGDDDPDVEMHAVFYWLPLDTESGIAVVFYNSSGGLLRQRTWIHGELVVRWRGEVKKVIRLKGGLWSEVLSYFKRCPITGEKDLWCFYQIEKALGFTPPSDAAVSWAEVNLWEIEGPGLNSTFEYRCVAPKQYESLSIEYREATVVVYSLTWTNTTVSGQLKLVDWAEVKPLEGFIVLLTKNGSASQIDYSVLVAKPYTAFSVKVKYPYEVWAIALPWGKNTIYGNRKYGRILLVKNPPEP